MFSAFFALIVLPILIIAASFVIFFVNRKKKD